MTTLYLTPHYLIRGKPPWAYLIQTFFPQCVWYGNPVHFRQVYDCRGLPADHYGRFGCVVQTDTGQKAYTCYGHGQPTESNFRGLDVIVDLRSVEMVARGCCPPAIMNAFLGTEGMPD